MTGVIDLLAGEGIILNTYHGIRFTMIPDGGNVTYSKNDDGQTEVHDPATQLTIVAETVVDVDWPWYYVSCDSGTARVALI